MPKQGHTRITSLKDEQVEEVKHRLRNGDNLLNIVDTIQKTWGQFKDVKPGTLCKNLQRYRDQVVTPEVVASVAGVAKNTPLGVFSDRLNAMDELNNLTRIQRGRFEKMLAREAQGPLLLKQVSEEGKILKDMLVDLGRLQLETGVLQRAPKKVTGSLLGADGQLRQFEWTEEQAQLMRELEDVDYAQIEKVSAKPGEGEY